MSDSPPCCSSALPSLSSPPPALAADNDWHNNSKSYKDDSNSVQEDCLLTQLAVFTTQWACRTSFCCPEIICDSLNTIS